MKNNISIYFFLSMIVFLTCSCDKQADIIQEKNGILKNPFSINSISDNDADISIVANRLMSNHISVDVNGSFFDENRGLLELEKFSVNGIEISNKNSSKPNFYQEHSSWLSNEEKLPQLLEVFGNSTEIEIKSNNFGNMIKSLSFPSIIELDLSANVDYERETISQSEDLIIKWNKDKDNEIMTRDIEKVGLLIIYHPGTSRREDSSLPSESISLNKLVDDTGELVIPSSELSVFPVGGIVTVLIGRGEQYSVTVNGNNVSINGVTYSISNNMAVVM